MKVFVVIDDFVFAGGQFVVEAWVTLAGETVCVLIDEAMGRLDGRVQWFPGGVFCRRLSRVERAALEQRLIDKARDQISVHAKGDFQ
jgi:hypothetical protein